MISSESSVILQLSILAKKNTALENTQWCNNILLTSPCFFSKSLVRLMVQKVLIVSTLIVLQKMNCCI